MQSHHTPSLHHCHLLPICSHRHSHPSPRQPRIYSPFSPFALSGHSALRKVPRPKSRCLGYQAWTLFPWQMESSCSVSLPSSSLWLCHIHLCGGGFCSTWDTWQVGRDGEQGPPHPSGPPLPSPPTLGHASKHIAP